MRVARWGFGVVLVLAACGGGKAPDGGATAAAVDPNNAAYLAVVEGEVSVKKADGALVPAAAEMTLGRADTLVTGADGRVVVVLHNRHVVKLGTSLEKRVEALAHFDDPPPSEDLTELFEQALGADYEQRLGGRDRLERIAGWNARRASGETPAPVQRREPPPPPAQAPEPIAEAPPKTEPAKDDIETNSIGLGDPGAIGRGAPNAGDAPGAKTDAKKTEADEDVGRGKQSKTRAPAERGEADGPPPKPVEKAGPPPTPSPADAAGQGAPVPGAEEAAAPDLADQWTLKTGANGQVVRAKLPRLLADRRGALARCIAEAGQRELTLEIEGGAIVAARFGAATASCASELVGQKLTDVGDAATVVVRLKG